MHLVLLLAMFFPPTTSTGPSAPRHGGGIVGEIRTERAAAPNAGRGVELAGQIRQLEERIDDLRESGQISRREARNMRRDARAISHAWWRYGNDGLSDSEADELQSRLLAANSLARPAPAPRGR
jgi:hypothetical protein